MRVDPQEPPPGLATRGLSGQPKTVAGSPAPGVESGRERLVVKLYARGIYNVGRGVVKIKKIIITITCID